MFFLKKPNQNKKLKPTCYFHVKMFGKPASGFIIGESAASDCRQFSSAISQTETGKCSAVVG